ncbi:MAG: hypothetical protein NTZ10_02140 [Candidatus Saganbacteria bacterium]|nr:hypothetical protein [Candidatus Saganbacteria bacterium]
MKNKTLAIFGIGTYILSVLLSATDSGGNSVAPITLISISGIATAVFIIMAIVRLWKEEKGASITLASSAIILFILSVVQGFASPSYGSPLIIMLNITKVFYFIAFIWTIIVLYRSKVINSHMITKIDNYHLNQPVNEAPDLKEYTAEEYQMFEMAGYKRISENEKIFRGGIVKFAYIPWGETTIGTIDNKIYKISLQLITQNEILAKEVFKTTLNYLIEQMDKYSEHPFLSNKYIWDAPEGNIIYEQINRFNQHCINIFITSSSIRDQVKNYISKH